MLPKWGIQGKILGFVINKAVNMKIPLTAFEYIRCVANILNSVVHAVK